VAASCDVVHVADWCYVYRVAQKVSSDINISQGSVATPLRCGGICGGISFVCTSCTILHNNNNNNNLFIANFLLSVTVKEFFKKCS